MTDRIESWENPPALPPTHYVDNRIFTDEQIFAEEQERIFAGGWKLIGHESELPENGSYRCFTLGGRPLLLVRGMDGGIRTFFNVCPHRGAPLARDERGTFKSRVQCFYHLWSFDLEGNCTGITRPVGYEPVGLDKKDVSLRPVRTELYRGLIFVSIKEDVESLADFLGPIRDNIELHFPDDEPLEVFHYHRSEMLTNWKLWVDNNSEQYHEYLHVLNRKTGLTQPKYHERRWHLNPNSHNVIDQGAMNYGNMGLEARSEGLMPGLQPDALMVMLLFPDVMINVRATVMRIDTITPVAPGRTIIEWRGLGLKSDSEEQRKSRVQHHNQVWGPAGRNLPEDVAAVESQYAAMTGGAFRYSIYAREEDLRPHDDSNLRAFYQEWGRRVGRWPHDPYAPRGDEPGLSVVGGAAGE
jgi:methanesulfonate monooxygenase subunit alpha